MTAMVIDTDKLEGDSDYRADLRHRFLTDHFFAAELMGFHDFIPRIHAPAAKMYGPKNPNLPLFEQCRKRNLLHLDPRHTFKTTLKRIDRLQWICAFPEEVTFLCESATQPLAEAIGKHTAKYFFRRKGTPATVLQTLFSEIVTEKDPQYNSVDAQRWAWNTPNRRLTGAGDLDATIAITSPQSTQSGWHPTHIDPDDVEDTKNSGITANAEVRQNVIAICNQNENLLRRGGYITIGGTRYHPFDWYGECVKRAMRNPKAWDVLVRASVHVRSGRVLMPGEFPEEEDLDLQFPELAGMDYATLRDMFLTDYETFMCQQQNDPQGGNIPTFPEQLYAGCLIAEERIPRRNDAQTFICWRPRYGGKPSMRRFSEGACSTLMDGKVYITDAWQGTYTPSGEAERIVGYAKQHDAEMVMLIGVPGSDYLAGHIRNEAARKNRSVRVQWIDYEEDDNARAGAIRQLEPLMKIGRVLFSTAITRAADCQKQFVHFGLAEENGIIECISRFANLIPLSQMRANMQEEEIEQQRRRREDALVQSFLEQQGMPAVDEEAQRRVKAHQAAMARATTWGMPPLPGGLDG